MESGMYICFTEFETCNRIVLVALSYVFHVYNEISIYLSFGERKETRKTM